MNTTPEPPAKYATREDWLQAAIQALRPWFSEMVDFSVPAKIRVTCGWPSRRPLSTKNRRIGECWPPEASEDLTTEIFISPYLSDPVDATLGVIPVLVHECVHAAVGNKHGHRGPFKKCAERVGLIAPWKSAHAGPALVVVAKTVVGRIGPYPHSRLDATKSPVKKQTTRMVKCLCATCGFTVRTTRKWLDEVGAPHCPKHGAMNFDPPESPKDSDEDAGGEDRE